MLAPPLLGAPRSLGQHVGGMVLSDRPLSGMVSIRAGAIAGRSIMGLGQGQRGRRRLRQDRPPGPARAGSDRGGAGLDRGTGGGPARPEPHRPCRPAGLRPDQRRPAKGVFLLQSPAQLQIARACAPAPCRTWPTRWRSSGPAWVCRAAPSPSSSPATGTGAAWCVDHPLEARALARTDGVIVWQEQVVQLIMDVAGMSAAEADTLRRAFARPQGAQFIAGPRQRFLAGARRRGVPEGVARTIFAKINGHYLFPQSHAHAFAITAYQAAC